MTTSIQATRERAGQLARLMNQMIDEQGNKPWDTVTQKRFDNAASELERLRAELNAMEADVLGSKEGDDYSAFRGNSSAAADEPKVFRATSPTFAKDLRAHFVPPRARLSASAESAITWSGFLTAAANGGRSKNPAIQAALTEGTDTAGGFTVPTVLMPGLLEALAPASSLLSAGAGLLFPQDGAKSYNFAGINTLPTAAWRSENGAVAESDTTFKNLQAVPRSLSFFFKFSRELGADSQNFERSMRTVMGQAFAKAIDLAGLRGSGIAPEPRGILNTAGIQAVTNGANGASLATNRYANFMSAIQATMQADAPAPTAAIMSPRSRVTLAGLVDTTNQPLAVPPLVSDLKLITTSQIPNNLTVGTSTDCSEIYVGDFSKVIFVMRESPSIQLADQLFATTGQLAFICHARVDVIVEYPQALSVITGVRP